MAYGPTIGDGSGDSEANAINIDSVSAWETLAATSADWGKYFKVTQNVDCLGVTLTIVAPDVATQFTGTFDGDGYSFSNFTLSNTGSTSGYTALFGAAEEGAVIKDLTVVNPILTAQSTYTGRNHYCGCFVAENEATITNCHIVNCSIEFIHGNIGTTGLYGMCGSIAGANHGYVDGCTATGTLSFDVGAGTDDSNWCSIGGLVGYQTGLPGGGGTPAEYLKNSNSSVAITSGAVFPAGYEIRLGGIAGGLVSQADSANYIENCHTTGAINYSSQSLSITLYLGGAIGRNQSITTKCSAVCAMEIIENSAVGTGISYLGGFTGNHEVGSGAALTIDESFCDVALRINYNAVDNSLYVGHFVGRALNPASTITNCYALGSIYDLRNDSTVINCKQYGGFTGFSTAASTTVNCWCAIATFSAGNVNVHGWGKQSLGTATDNFWDSTLSGIVAAEDGATAKTTTDLQTLSEYPVGYDFSSTGEWKMTSVGLATGMYPLLEWETFAYSGGNGTQGDPYCISNNLDLSYAIEDVDNRSSAVYYEICEDFVYDTYLNFKVGGSSGNRYSGGGRYGG